MKKFDVIFFCDITDSVAIYQPLGAAKLAHVLRSHGYSCLVVNHLHTFNETDFCELIDHCVSDRTKLLGFSGTFLTNIEGIEDVLDPNSEKNFGSMNFNRSFFPQGKKFEDAVIKKIKSVNPNCKIALGGISQEIQNKNINFYVAGYAESAILNLVNHLSGKEQLNNSRKNIYGITVIDDRNASEYNFAESTMQWLPEDIFNAKVLPIEIARGCVFNCTFCSYPMRGKKNLDFVRKPKFIQAELEENYEKYGITTYSLMDDTFNDNDEKIDILLEVSKKLKFQPIYWCYARLDLLSVKKERLQKMYDLGVRSMFFGIETFHQSAGKIIKKGFDPNKQIDTVIKIRNKYNNEIMMHGSFIIGLPEEPLDHVRKISNKILSGEIPLHSWRFNPLKIWRSAHKLWSSDFEKNYQKYGFIDKDSVVKQNLFDKDHREFINWKTKHTTYDECVQLANELNNKGFESNRYHIPNQLAWAFMNYPEFDFKKVSNIKYNKIDWHNISVMKKTYIIDYKNQLFKFLKS